MPATLPVTTRVAEVPQRALAAVVFAAPAPTYLPTLASAPLGAWGAKRMVSGYSGNLYQLRRSSDNATLDVAAAPGSDLSDYAAIATWAGAGSLFVTTVYDQSGNAKHMTQATTASQPAFDLTQTRSGLVPFLFDGVRSSVAKSVSNTALSLNRNNFTFFEAVNHIISLQNCSHWGLESTGTTRFRVYTQANLDGVQINDQSTIRALGTGSVPRSQTSVIGLTSNGSAIYYYNREARVDSGAVGSAATANTLILGTGTGANYNGRSRRWGWVLYPALSDADAVSLRAALTAMFNVTTSFGWRLVLDGDSINEGTGSVLLKNMAQQLVLRGTPEVFNMAIHGQTLAAINTNYPTYIAPLFTSAYGAGKCILYNNAGTNDLSTTAAAALYTTASSYISAAKATGFKVGIGTLLPRGDYASGSTNDVRRTTYNSSVLANSGAADFTPDPANASTHMGPYAATADSTLFNADLLHPTTVGYGYLASEVYSAALNTAAGV